MAIHPHERRIRSVCGAAAEKGQVVNKVFTVQVSMVKVSFKHPPFWFDFEKEVAFELQPWHCVVGQAGQPRSGLKKGGVRAVLCIGVKVGDTLR